jgi:4-hydroxybenzoate polyprenyltransferase
MKITSIIELLRIKQWYKNLAIFLAIFFIGPTTSTLIASIETFIAFCLVSSTWYIFNDILDAKTDKIHPEKKKRPIASGEISYLTACITVLILILILPTLNLTENVIILLIILGINNLIYNLWGRNIALIDVHMIALNFLIRAVAGAEAIHVESSVWLVTTVFFTALLFAVSKRNAELMLLGKNAIKFKKVYLLYTKEILDMMRGVIAAILLISYTLYVFFVHKQPIMIATIPIASFIMFKYLYYTIINHKIARKIHHIFLDPHIILGLGTWCIIIIYGVYK